MNGIARVQEMEMAREAVNLLMNNVWHGTVTDFCCVSSSVLWVKFKFSKVKVCVVLRVYSPTERDFEKREKF